MMGNKYYDILLAEDYRGWYLWKVLEDSDEYTNPVIVEEGKSSTIDEAYQKAKDIMDFYKINRQLDETDRINFDAVIPECSETT